MPEKDMKVAEDVSVASIDAKADREAQILYTRLIFCLDAVNNEAIQKFETQYLVTPEKQNIFRSLRQHSGYNEQRELVALNSFSIEELRRALLWHSKFCGIVNIVH